MERPAALYVIFSATSYRIGRMIRSVTREPYNHVSLATDGELGTLYAFARRYYRTPLYGGFVTESPGRFHHLGITADIRMCRLPLTEAQGELLKAILEEALENPDHYLYNHLSALAAPFGRKVRLRDAYTCAEFAVSVLSRLGFPIDEERFYTIGDIADALEPYHVYSGPFPHPAAPDPAFFQPKPMTHPFLATVKGICALFRRFET